MCGPLREGRIDGNKGVLAELICRCLKDCLEEKDECVKDDWERWHSTGEVSMCEWLRVAAAEMGNRQYAVWFWN